MTVRTQRQGHAVQAALFIPPRKGQAARPARPTKLSSHPALDRMRFLFTMSDIGRTRIARRRNSPVPVGPSRPSTAKALHAPDETDESHRKDLKRRTRRQAGGDRPTRRRAQSAGRPQPRSSPSSVARPPSPGWWSQTGSNRRPHACKARALPTELWPRQRTEKTTARRRKSLPFSVVRSPSSGWWAWEDLNLRPHAYQARALTN